MKMVGSSAQTKADCSALPTAKLGDQVGDQGKLPHLDLR